MLQGTFDVKNDVALVTGAAHGVGRAIAQALVGQGVRTVFADINSAGVEEAIAESPRSDIAISWAGDLAQRDGCERLMALVDRDVGRVTHFVHAASPPRIEADHVLAVDDSTWRTMHAVNLDAGFYLSRGLARKLISDRRPGSFLLLTSLHASTPRNLPHYSTAKAGLEILVKEFAKALGQFGIRVNALVPGVIAAGGFAADPKLARHIPLGRLGQPRDLTPMALAILSDQISAYITGTSIIVDGGLATTNWFDAPDLTSQWLNQPRSTF